MSEDVFNKLKECPVCQCQSDVLDFGNFDTVTGNTYHYVYCMVCDIRCEPCITKEDAIKEWNSTVRLSDVQKKVLEHHCPKEEEGYEIVLSRDITELEKIDGLEKWDFDYGMWVEVAKISWGEQTAFLRRPVTVWQVGDGFEHNHEIYQIIHSLEGKTYSILNSNGIIDRTIDNFSEIDDLYNSPVKIPKKQFLLMIIAKLEAEEKQ